MHLFCAIQERAREEAMVKRHHVLAKEKGRKKGKEKSKEKGKDGGPTKKRLPNFSIYPSLLHFNCKCNPLPSNFDSNSSAAMGRGCNCDLTADFWVTNRSHDPLEVSVSRHSLSHLVQCFFLFF